MTEATPEERAEGLVSLFLDDRLESANEPAGLRKATADKVAVRLDEIVRRCGEQCNSLRSPSSRRIPDAYFADEEIAEDELQAAAAGIRTARALGGGVLSDPKPFEHDLARSLAPSALWALRGEASRVPRPTTRPSVLNWSLAPIQWVEDHAKWPPADAIALVEVRQLVGADGGPVAVGEKPYEGWIQLGMVELQATLATRYPDVVARKILVATGLEMCDGLPPANSMPFGNAAPDVWTVCYEDLAIDLDAERAHRILSSAQGPLAAFVDFEGQMGAPADDRGVGLQRFTLAPRIEVVAGLGLRPEIPAMRHVLVDDNGAALVGRQWHGFLVHDGNYSPLEPAIHGADLILRPDLYEILVNTTGKDRLVIGVVTRLVRT